MSNKLDATFHPNTTPTKETPADLCRRKGWTPGDVLMGKKNDQIVTIRITAIGEDAVLGRRLTTNMTPDYRDDRTWEFTSRGWTWGKP